jgi:hypothetical protein
MQTRIQEAAGQALAAFSGGTRYALPFPPEVYSALSVIESEAGL